MKRYNKTTFGLKEDEFGDYVEIYDYQELNNKISKLEYIIERRDRLIDKMEKENNKARKLTSSILEIIFDNVSNNSSTKEKLIKSLYGIDKDAKMLRL